MLLNKTWNWKRGFDIEQYMELGKMVEYQTKHGNGKESWISVKITTQAFTDTVVVCYVFLFC